MMPPLTEANSKLPLGQLKRFCECLTQELLRSFMSNGGCVLAAKIEPQDILYIPPAFLVAEYAYGSEDGIAICMRVLPKPRLPRFLTFGQYMSEVGRPFDNASKEAAAAAEVAAQENDKVEAASAPQTEPAQAKTAEEAQNDVSTGHSSQSVLV